MEATSIGNPVLMGRRDRPGLAVGYSRHRRATSAVQEPNDGAAELLERDGPAAVLLAGSTRIVGFVGFIGAVQPDKAPNAIAETTTDGHEMCDGVMACMRCHAQSENTSDVAF